MTEADDGRMVKMEVSRFRDGTFSKALQNIAREVPCTIIANDVEIATLSCTPANLREFAAGFLFTAGIIDGIGELLACDIDSARWNLACSVSRTPDIGLMNRRTYTSGCGRGVIFSNLNEFLARSPIDSGLTVTAGQIAILSNWLQHSSPLFRETGGVHTAALAVRGDLPEWSVDDIGRHNAADKAIGRGLLGGVPFGECALVTTGRTSSDILFKARRAGIPITISRGSPTHQTILRALDLNITVVGFARGGAFTVYSHPQRIIP
ncbi:MAG: formate dehydrogenase accessory sulfurtransferase FdhD [Candidatus Krumholzibacteria bacterium]|nr:formate dehydrogenase accessory sulfurtransferase FdhD [Candidatus Krumholzibacteria bacterium]